MRYYSSLLLGALATAALAAPWPDRTSDRVKQTWYPKTENTSCDQTSPEYEKCLGSGRYCNEARWVLATHGSWYDSVKACLMDREKSVARKLELGSEEVGVANPLPTVSPPPIHDRNERRGFNNAKDQKPRLPFLTPKTPANGRCDRTDEEAEACLGSQLYCKDEVWREVKPHRFSVKQYSSTRECLEDREPPAGKPPRMKRDDKNLLPFYMRPPTQGSCDYYSGKAEPCVGTQEYCRDNLWRLADPRQAPNFEKYDSPQACLSAREPRPLSEPPIGEAPESPLTTLAVDLSGRERDE